jgi:hypothetical protein
VVEVTKLMPPDEIRRFDGSIEEDKLQLCTLLLPVTFLLANVLHFSQQIPNQRKILSCFDTHI